MAKTTRVAHAQEHGTSRTWRKDGTEIPGQGQL